MRGLAWVALLAAGCAGSGTGAPDTDYDLVIRRGTIVDGSGRPGFAGDLAISADRIAAVGHVPGRGLREIDATGRVVAPGFIDIHSHSDWVLLEDGAAHSKIRQGVTTEVLGEGASAGPFKGKLQPRQVAAGARRFSIATLGDYLGAVEAAGIAVNVLSYVGQNNVWQCVMGDAFDPPGPAQLDQMKALVAEAMQDGAFGLSTMLMMPPGSLATTDQLVQLCEPVRAAGGLFSSHIHDEGLGVFESIDQVVEVGRRASVPVDVIHLKIADQKFWGRMNEVVARIEQARRDGVAVQANVYPYTRGNNDLASIIPPWAHEGGTAAMLERLADPDQRARLKREIRQGLPGWYNHFTAVGGDWSRMLVSADNPYKGMTMDRLIADKSRGRSPPPRSAGRALRPADRAARLGGHRLRAPHRGGHERGAGPALVLDRVGRLGAGRRGPAAPG
jgi:N-acyl-D-aspartate/D-glutamate deacylase